MQRQHLIICLGRFGSLFCDLLTNSFIYASCGFQKYQKMFNQKIYPRERCEGLGVTPAQCSTIHK